jgi:DNA-directed RNA polymerase subunit RPC12/RpoP
MPTCARCKKSIIIKNEIRDNLPTTVTRYGVGNYLCTNCWILCFKEYEEQGPPPRPEIKCPFCGQMFSPVTKTPTTTHGNIARGIAFLPWGVVSALKNKSFVQCPHCKMNIPQG